jgi:hypothetical protein
MTRLLRVGAEADPARDVSTLADDAPEGKNGGPVIPRRYQRGLRSILLFGGAMGESLRQTPRR